MTLDREVKFRTMDGSCNNLEETNYGRAGTPLQRILDPSYGGKISLYLGGLKEVFCSSYTRRLVIVIRGDPDKGGALV